MTDLVDDGFLRGTFIREREREDVAADLRDLRYAVVTGSQLVEAAAEVTQPLARLADRVGRVLRATRADADARIAEAESRSAEAIREAEARCIKQVQAAEARYGALAAALHADTVKDFPDPIGFYVYSLWSHGRDIPCYVGSSQNLYARLGQHARDPRKQGWARVSVTEYDTEREMRDAERALIAHYQPRWNVVGIRVEQVPA